MLANKILINILTLITFIIWFIMNILILLVFSIIISACDSGFGKSKQTSSQFINNSDPEMDKKNQDLLEQLEKEQQKKLQDKFNKMLEKAKDEDLVNDKNKFEEMKTYIISINYILLSPDKKNILDNELKKNPIILAYTNDPDKKHIKNVSYVFALNTNDALLNKYDPTKKAQLEKERNKQLEEEKKERNKQLEEEKKESNARLDFHKIRTGSFTEKEKQDFKNEQLKVNNFPLIKPTALDINTIINIDDDNIEQWDKHIENFVRSDANNINKLLNNDIITAILDKTKDPSYNTSTEPENALLKLFELADKNNKDVIIKELLREENLQKITESPMLLSSIKNKPGFEKITTNELVKLNIISQSSYNKEKLEAYLNVADKELQQKRLNDLLYNNYLNDKFESNELEAVNILAKVNKDKVVKNIVDNKLIAVMAKHAGNYQEKFGDYRTKSTILRSLNKLDILESIGQETIVSGLFQLINNNETIRNDKGKSDAATATAFTNFIQELVEQKTNLKNHLVMSANMTIYEVIYYLKDENKINSIVNYLKTLSNEQLVEVYNHFSKYSNKEAATQVLRAYINKNNIYNINIEQTKQLQLKPQIADYFSKFINKKMQNPNDAKQYAESLFSRDFVKFLNNLSALDNSDETTKTLSKYVFVYHFYDNDKFSKNKERLKNTLDKTENQALKQRIQEGFNQLKLDYNKNNEETKLNMTYNFLFP